MTAKVITPALALALTLLGCVRDTPGFCQVDTDCPQDQRCALPQMECQTGVRGCKVQSDCAADKLCAPGGACVDVALRGVLSAAQAAPPTCSLASGLVRVALINDADGGGGGTALVHAVHTVQAASGDLPMTLSGARLTTVAANTDAVTAIPLAVDQADALKAGRAQISVPTMAFPGGELAAPLRPVSASEPVELLALLGGTQEAPPVVTKASGLATLSLDDTALRFSISALTIKEITGAHIHKGTFNQPGAVLLDFLSYAKPTADGSGNSTVSGQAPRADATPELIGALRAGQAYVNVHTAAFPGGEISGMLLPFVKGAPRAVARPFQAVFNSKGVPVPPSPVDPAAQGVAAFTLSQDNKALTYRLSHGVKGAALVAHLHRAAAVGVTATADLVICTLGDASDGGQGTCVVNPGVGGLSELSLSDLTSGKVYIDVHPDRASNSVAGGFLTLPALQ